MTRRPPTPLLRVVSARRMWRTPTGEEHVLSITNGRSTIIIGGDDLREVADALCETLTARVEQHSRQQGAAGEAR